MSSELLGVVAIIGGGIVLGGVAPFDLGLDPTLVLAVFFGGIALFGIAYSTAIENHDKKQREKYKKELEERENANNR